MNKPPEVPEEAFHAFTILLPRLLDLPERACGLEPIELYLLWYIRHFGKQTDDGRVMFLRHRLTELLTRQFHLSANSVSNLIGSLHEQGLIETGARLRREQLKELYDSEGGRAAIVCLCPKGHLKIEAFKSEVNRAVASLVNQLPITLRKPFRAMITQIARWVLNHSMQNAKE